MIGYVKFEGGPLDQYVYATEVLLGDQGLNLPVFEYLWTSEKVTSEKTGATAQVWKHRDLISGAPDRPDPATVAKLSTAGGPATAAPPPAPTPAAAAAPPATSPQPAAPAASVEAPAATSNTQPAVAAATPIAAVSAEAVGVNGHSAPGLDGGSLIERRKALKLSRKDAADATGLAISKIIAIETDTGKRVKPEERRTLVEFIEAREGQAQPVSAHA